MQNLKTGKFYDQAKKTSTTQPKSKTTQEDWKNTEREKARARAQQYAKMQYAEFIKTDFYKSVVSLDTIASHLGFFIALTVIVIFPIVATILYGVAGLGAGLLINFIALPMTVPAIRKASSLNLGEFSNSALHIVRTNGFLIATLTITNVIIILLFDLQTLINPWLLIVLFGFAILITYILNLKYKNTDKFKLHFRSFCIAPLIVNSFFLTNYIFSSNPVKETYLFQNDMQATKRGQQEGTYIYLENGAYSEFPTLRTFLDYEEMRNRKHVTYTFKTGLLGFRVATDHEFTP